MYSAVKLWHLDGLMKQYFHNSVPLFLYLLTSPHNISLLITPSLSLSHPLRDSNILSSQYNA